MILLENKLGSEIFLRNRPSDDKIGRSSPVTELTFCAQALHLEKYITARYFALKHGNNWSIEVRAGSEEQGTHWL